MAVSPAPVRVPSQRQLALNVTSVTNDKGDNEMILGAVHRSPGICLTAEENPARRPSDEGAVSISHRLKWGPFPPNEVGRIAQHSGREKEGNKERTWRGYFYLTVRYFYNKVVC